MNAAALDQKLLPHGSPVDRNGNPRQRYVRVIHGASSVVMAPAEALEMVACDPESYLLEDVFLSVDEFNALPEFGGF